MEIESPHRYELKAQQLRAELRAHEQRIGKLGSVMKHHEQCRNEQRLRFDEVRMRLRDAAPTNSPRLALHQGESLARMLQARGKQIATLDERLSLLKGEMVELHRMHALTERRKTHCTETAQNLRSDCMTARAEAELEEVGELARRASTDRASLMGRDEKVDEAERESEVADRDESDVDQSTALSSPLTVESVSKGDSSPSPWSSDPGSQHRPPHQGSERGGGEGCNSGSPHQTAPAASLHQFIDRIEELSRFSTAYGDGLSLTYVTSRGNKLTIKVEGGGETPVRLAIAPESIRDRGILWGESRAIVAALRARGVNVAEVRVGGAFAKGER